MRIISRNKSLLILVMLLSCLLVAYSALADSRQGDDTDISSAVQKAKNADQKRDAAFKILISKWTPAQQLAFNELQKKANDFFSACSKTEIGLSDLNPYESFSSAADYQTDAQTVDQIKAKTALKNNLNQTLVIFEQGKLPNFSAQDFEKNDSQLNTLYLKVIKISKYLDNHADLYNVNSEKNAQRAWLHYRDTWVKFGAARYPNVSADSWKSWLTQQRIQQLNNYLAALEDYKTRAIINKH